MSLERQLISLKNKANSTPVAEALDGLEWMKKVFTSDRNHCAFLSRSTLALDTNSIREAGITYEATHQDQTSIDQEGNWLDANKVNYFVLPEGFATRYHHTPPR